MENLTNNFVALLEALNCDDSDVNNKLQCYLQVRQLLDSTFAVGQTIQDYDVLRSLYECACLDLELDDADVQFAALQTMEHFLKFDWTESLVSDISSNLSSLAFNEKYKSRPDISSTALSCIRGSLRELILHNYCDPATLCLKVEKEAKVKIFELFEEVLLDLGAIKLTKSRTFFHDVLIHQMYITSDPNLRSLLIKPAIHLVNHFKFSQLSTNQIDAFIGKVSELYHPQITKLQKANDPNWSHLWIFLLNYMGKVLFETAYISIMNSLLKNIENSFRGTISDKLAAFDCWQALIDNYGNDTQRMAALKQINLVLTPLRRILSREEVYVEKRFETFCHLINVFQENNADVYLPILLSFCFTTFTETYENDNKIQISFVRKIPSLREKGIQVFVEILGHYGHDSQECVLNKNTSCIKLKKPLISAHNYVQHRIHIKNSIVECAMVMLSCVRKELIPKGIQCLWGALFLIISQLDARQQEIELKELATVIVNYGKSSDNTNSYQNFFVPILKLFMSNRFVDTKLFIDAFLLPLIKECVDMKNHLLVRNIDVIQHLINTCIDVDNRVTWIKEVGDIFEKVALDSVNLEFIIQIWCIFIKRIIQLAKISQISEKCVDQFMLFPVPLMEKITDTKKLNMVSKTWGLSFMELCQIDKKYEDLVKKLHNSMKTLGVFQSSAILFLPGMDCFFKGKNRVISDFLVTSFLHLTVEILSTSNIIPENISKCCTYITNISRFYGNQTHKLEDSSFKILCKCYELLCTAQKFENLKLIDNLFDNCSKERREILSQTLLKVISATRSNPDKAVAQLAILLTAKLSNKTKKNELFLTPKISFPKATPPTKSSKIITLFGQPVEAKTPQVKESLPNNGNSGKSVVIKKKKAVKHSVKVVPAINDENSENFVPINGGYVFEAEKLTEHQIEVLKKTRPDIPALYQDLSQSQSNSQVIFEKFYKASSSTMSSNGSENEVPLNDGENETAKLVKNENGVINPSLTNDMEALETELKDLLDNSSSLDNKSKVSSPINDTASESEPKLVVKKKSGRIKAQRLSATPEGVEKILPLIIRRSLPNTNPELTKSQKVQKELAKIKMDIVGGEQFTKHLNWSDKIQTRRSGDFVVGTRSKRNIVKLDSTKRRRTISESTKNYTSKKKEDSVKKAKSRLFTELPQSDDDLNKKVTLNNSNDNDLSKKTKTSLAESVDNLNTTTSLENELPKNDDLVTEPVKNNTNQKRKLTEESAQSDEAGPSTTELSQGDDSSEKPIEPIQISSRKPKRVNLIRVIDTTAGNIPREPPQTVDDKVQQDLIDSKLSNLSHELSITLVNKPPLQNSEDVIESSQDTFVEIVPLKSFVDDTTTSAQLDPKEPLIKDTASEINSCSSIFTEDVVSVPMIPVTEEVIEIKDSQDDINMEDIRVDSPDELIRRDLITDVIKTLDTAEMDTESCDANLCSPATAELPTSPIRSDTPSRAKELMDNTINISPIKTLLQLDCNMEEKIQKAQKLFDIEMDAASEPEVPPPVNGSSRTAINGNSRGAKLLNSIGYKSPMMTASKNTSVKSRPSFVPTQKPSRVAKMMQNCGGDVANANLERNCEDDPKQFVPEKDFFAEKDVLTFVRTLPSPMASPRFSILKRKTPDSRDEDVSPPRKQARRVNFPDPPTTSEKVFFMDHCEENKRRLRSNESLFTELFNENKTDAKRMAMEIFESEPESIEMETQVMETQGSVDVTDPTLLDSDVPIFEDLVDCTEGVENILESVTSAFFEKTLLKELNARNIKSVGDLAKLSEREVHRLPFRVPKVETVRRVLGKFKESLVEIRTEPLEQIFPGPSTSKAAIISPLLESESDLEEQNRLDQSCPVPSTSKDVTSQVASEPNRESEENHSNDVFKEKSYQNIVSLTPKEDLKAVVFNILDEINEEDRVDIAVKILNEMKEDNIKDFAFKTLHKMKISEIIAYSLYRVKEKGD